MYNKGNCRTRAKTALATGQSRLKNAEMAFSTTLNSSTISAYNKQKGIMFDDSQEALKDIKADGNEQDVARLKTGMVPRLEQLSKQTASLAGQIGELLNQVRQTAGGDPGAMAGCAKSIITGSSDGASGLVGPLMAMLEMVKNMGTNLAATAASIVSL